MEEDESLVLMGDTEIDSLGSNETYKLFSKQMPNILRMKLNVENKI